MDLEKIYIINGPNLNLVGLRQPEIYGDLSFEEYIPTLRLANPTIYIEYFQSNHEGVLIDFIHTIGFEAHNKAIINAGGFSHTSIAIADALASVPMEFVEVHLSDITQRESFRKHSYITAHALKMISGKGMEGYREAIQFLLAK